MPSPKLFAGVDLGGTNMQVGVVDAQGVVLARAKKKTRAEEGAARVIQRIVDGVHEACVHAGVSPAGLGGIGVGAPGAIDIATGTVRVAPNLRWADVPLGKTLARKLGKPVYVDNDVRSAIVGEHRHGAGRGATELFGLWIGTGIGGGIVLRNHIYTGHFGSAGEVGHTTLFPFAPPGSRSLEHTCSRTAIADRLVRLIRAGNASLISELTAGDLTEIKARVIATAFSRGDKLTKQVIENAALCLGVGLASVVTLLSVQRIVLGGGLTEAMGESLVALVRESVRAHAFPEACKRVEVVATKLEADAGVVGSASLAREHLKPGALRVAKTKSVPSEKPRP